MATHKTKKQTLVDAKVHSRRAATIEVQHKNGRRVHIPRAWVIDEKEPSK